MHAPRLRIDDRQLTAAARDPARDEETMCPARNHGQRIIDLVTSAGGEIGQGLELLGFQPLGKVSLQGCRIAANARRRSRSYCAAKPGETAAADGPCRQGYLANCLDISRTAFRALARLAARFVRPPRARPSPSFSRNRAREKARRASPARHEQPRSRQPPRISHSFDILRTRAAKYRASASGFCLPTAVVAAPTSAAASAAIAAGCQPCNARSVEARSSATLSSELRCSTSQLARPSIAGSELSPPARRA